MKLHPKSASYFSNTERYYKETYYTDNVLSCAEEFASSIESMMVGIDFNCQMGLITDKVLLDTWDKLYSKYKPNKYFSIAVLRLLEDYWFIGDIIAPKVRKLINAI